MANILIINSSARKNSNSNALSEQAALGAREKGHEVAVLDISRMNIASCKGCEGCHQPKSKGCVQKDDMRQCYAPVRDADVIVFTSPIYWFTYCGQIKQFIDRCYAIGLPEGDEPGVFTSKKIGAIFAYGGDDVFDSGCINAIRTLQDTASYLGAVWAGALYGAALDAGQMAHNTEMMRKAREYGASL